MTLNGKLLLVFAFVLTSFPFLNEVYADTTQIDASDGARHRDDDDNDTCDNPTQALETTLSTMGMSNTGSSIDCYVTDEEFVIPSSLEGATVTAIDLVLELDIFTTTPIDVDVAAIDFDDLSSRTTSQRGSSILNGAAYLDNHSLSSVGSNTLSLNAAAISDLQTVIDAGGGLFSLGVRPNTITEDGTDRFLKYQSHSNSIEPRLVITYDPPSPPDAVDDLAANNITGTAVDLSWTEPDLHGAPLSHYNIYRISPHGTPVSIFATTTDTSFTDSSLVPTTQYSYLVAAVTSVGTDTTGNVVDITTTNVAPPTGLSTTTLSGTSIKIDWNAPTLGDAPTSYKIERESPIGGGWSTIVADTGNTSLSYTDTGLGQGVQYNYRVSSINGANTSSPSSESDSTTFGAPSKVTGLTVSNPSVDSLDLSWSTPSANGFAIEGYKIERESPIGGGWSTIVADTGNTNTTYVDEGLSAGTQYNYRISAINEGGIGSPSDPVSDITLTTPPTLLIVNPVGTSTSTLDLSWNAPVPSTGVTGYKIEREDSVGGGWNTIVADTGNTDTTYTDTGLSVNTFYNYRVSAITSNGVSATSNTYSQTTYALPDPVDDLTAVATDLIGVRLEWTEPDTLNGYLLGYKIIFTTPIGTPDTVYLENTFSSDTTHDVTGLVSSQDYSFSVSAITIHGENFVGANVADATAFSEFDVGNVNLPKGPNPTSNPIKFSLNEIDDDTDDLVVTYDSSQDLSCTFDYKFSRENQTYSDLLKTPTGSGSAVTSTFTINDAENDIIDIYCWDILNPDTDESYRISQESVPLFNQITDFQDGLFGTGGNFGALDFVTLLAIVVSMIGFNRVNPAVGIIVMVFVLGALSYYGLIELTTLIFGVIALVILLAIGTVRKS